MSDRTRGENNETIRKMEKEVIEKAVNNYIGYEPEIDEGLGSRMRRDAFRDGAEWRINAVWHDTSEAPKKNKHIALMLESGNLTSWYVTADIMQKFKEHKGIMWAYIDDLLPEIREEQL